MREIIDAELQRDGKGGPLIARIEVDLIVDEVDEGELTNLRVGVCHGFAPDHPPVENGQYLVTYLLPRGKQQGPEEVRVKDMRILSGWGKS
jgi:hypothetical protein